MCYDLSVYIHPSSNSQAGQESFVLSKTNYKKFGTYIEVGAYHPKIDSNTYVLETEFNWTGISLEINQARSDFFNLTRKNQCICTNALTYNFKKELKQNNFPVEFDYLQIDIEPALNSFLCLLKFPINTYTPRIITFEHDKYANRINWVFQKLANFYLTVKSYKRVVKDVSPLNSKLMPFEDWYLKI